MKQAEYGQVYSAKDTELLQDSQLPKASQEGAPQDISSVGNALWSYKTEGKINGVPVKSSDAGLPIDREDLLQAAFQLESIPRSMLLWLSPDDEEAIAKYDELLNRVYNGSVIIVDEMKQYDSAKSKIMVWIRYNEVSYALHQRFQYLREEVTK